jgi:3-deoxy-manno-octulosonate cytidylyltransferase (CMP-KDO synthetase)
MAIDQVLIVIPARLSSTRLPEKMLLKETGTPLICHTIEAAARSRLAGRVVVGTEDAEIVAAVRAFGAEAILTGKHATGTDRVAEVARHFPDTELVVNVQGDEPEIEADDIDLAIDLLRRNPHADMATLAAPIRDPSHLDDPACVKVVFARSGRALWFSRSPIPHVRDRTRDWFQHEPPIFHRHVGLYAYRAEFLQRIPALPPSDAERVESLEQLRVLIAGHLIQVGIVRQAHKGIDTPEDYAAFVARFRTKPSAMQGSKPG